MEEIQHEVDIRQFDMERATMLTAGCFLALEVGGNACVCVGGGSWHWHREVRTVTTRGGVLGVLLCQPGNKFNFSNESWSADAHDR